MRLKLPPYVHGFADRHGKARYYFRKAGSKRVTLPGLPWSTEFMATHSSAMNNEAMPLAIGASRTIPGTISALTVAYFNSSAFGNLSPSTQATYRNIIQRFRNEHGEKRVGLLERQHIQVIIGKKTATPSAANNFLRMVRMLMQFAILEGLRRDDPTIGIKAFKTGSDGFHTWTEGEIATFEEKHPPGTRARLAFALMLYTGQRRGDVVTMGRQHVRSGALRIRQQKTGMLIEIPIHSALQSIIDFMPASDMTFLVTDWGKPFTSNGFGNWFRDRCDEAGLDGCSAHGLRKATCRRLAEAGCTAHEIMSISGHKTLKEVTRYTSAVDRKHLANSAMSKIGNRTSIGKP